MKSVYFAYYCLIKYWITGGVGDRAYIVNRSDYNLQSWDFGDDREEVLMCSRVTMYILINEKISFDAVNIQKRTCKPDHTHTHYKISDVVTLSPMTI